MKKENMLTALSKKLFNQKILVCKQILPFFVDDLASTLEYQNSQMCFSVMDGLLVSIIIITNISDYTAPWAPLVQKLMFSYVLPYVVKVGEPR